MAHGTRGFLNQIMHRLITFKSYSFVIKHHKFRNQNIEKFTNKIIKIQRDEEKIKLIGPAPKKVLNKDAKDLFLTKFNLTVNTACVGSRLKYREKMFSSINYKRKNKSNNFLVSYGYENYGEIHDFFLFQSEIYVLLKRLKIEKLTLRENRCFKQVRELFERFYLLVKDDDDDVDELYDLIHCSELKKKCIRIKIKSACYITKIEYEFEHD